MTVKPSKLILKATADFAYELLSWIYGNTLAHPQLYLLLKYNFK